MLESTKKVYFTFLLSTFVDNSKNNFYEKKEKKMI